MRTSEAVAWAARRLAAAGVAAPVPEAQQLTAHVLGVERARLALAPPLSEPQREQLDQLVRRRQRREPLQHLTGTVGFGRLELAVGPGVFIPRPETELLAQWAVATAAGLGVDGGTPVVVDLASGTGALALSIAHELPAARVFAVERSPAALDWLRRNAAARQAAGDRPVTVVAGDATDPALLAHLDGGVDLVVSNPPYVPAGQPVPPEVADHDPPEAVFAGPDGLAVIRPLLLRAAQLLRPGGWLGLEHDESQAALLPALLGCRFGELVDHRDLAGRPRFVTARRVADLRS